MIWTSAEGVYTFIGKSDGSEIDVGLKFHLQIEQTILNQQRNMRSPGSVQNKERYLLDRRSQRFRYRVHFKDMTFDNINM